MAAKKANTYQLKITLEGVSPPIWRRVLIDSSQSLANLHWVIQIAMGWQNSHLHHFIHEGEFYSEPNPFGDDLMDTRDSHGCRIDRLLRREKDWLRYEYDFGDGWLHKVVLEKMLPLEEKAGLPKCIEGKRACPPEDVGGIWGYEGFVAAVTDKNHDSHQEMLEWVGGEFDPEALDVDEINQAFQDWQSA